MSDLMFEESTPIRGTKPRPGEMFKLVEALIPTRMSIEVAKAWNAEALPYLLTYRGRETGAIVRTMFVA